MKVLFFATIRDLTREKETMAEGADTVMELLLQLSDRYGREFREEALDGEAVSDRIIVLVNGRNIAHTGGGETRLAEGDTVAIFPIIGGG
ncbi:MAG: MoaD family protein [Aminivibrio sp.]|nr:MoaD family protein [Aminivibrio sp.]